MTHAAMSRRQLLTGGERPKSFRPLPPGATMASLAACTGCSACVKACPESVLRIAAGKVRIDFAEGECSFCGACAKACPEPVFDGPVSGAPARMAHRAELRSSCLVNAGIACMTCRDACPEQAIALVPRIGGPFRPALDAAACTGCGACVAPCPAKAIALRPLEAQEAAHA